MTAEDTLALHLDGVGIAYEREYRAIPGRRYRWDFRIGNLLIEIQGGIWMPAGGHNTGRGLTRDYAKNNLAVLHGYRCLFFTPAMVDSGEAITTIEAVLND